MHTQICDEIVTVLTVIPLENLNVIRAAVSSVCFSQEPLSQGIHCVIGNSGDYCGNVASTYLASLQTTSEATGSLTCHMVGNMTGNLN